MKGTEKGSRMTEERQGKGWIKKNNETNKGIQPETIKVYGSLKYLRVLHQRVGNAAVPGTHITSVHSIILEKKVVKAVRLSSVSNMMRIGICVPFLPGTYLSVKLQAE